MSSVLPGAGSDPIDRTRTDDSAESATLIGYKNRQAPGEATPWFGDDDGPYEWPQAAYSPDGVTGITPQTVPGSPQKLNADAYGRLRVLTSEDRVPDNYSATGVDTGETSHSVAENLVLLLEYVALNPVGSTDPLWLLVFDSATLPPDGTVPTLTAVPVAAGDTTAVDVGEEGLLFGNGITVVLSTTPLELTASGVSTSFTIVYR